MENTSNNNETDPTAVNQTTVERTERNKYKIPILSDKETDLSKANPKMWWEQISEYIDLTYQKKLDELMEQGTDSMDPHTTYNIKGEIIWALGPKAKQEIISPPVDCSTEKTKQRTAKDFDNTPTGSPQKTHMSTNRGVVELNLDGGGEYRKQGGGKRDS